MTNIPTRSPQPIGRDLIDARSSRAGAVAPRKPPLNDPRSTGGR